MRQLEAQVRELGPLRTADEARAAAREVEAAELEARLLEVSGFSEDALRRAAEAERGAALLTKAAHDKDARFAALEKLRETLDLERGRAEQKHAQAEAAFRERLKRELDKKEQELIEEVSYLRKTISAKDRRIKEVAIEKAHLERRAPTDPAAVAADASKSSVEPHVALARALGDPGEAHPCARLLDDPLLMFTAVLMKQPLIRRAFYTLSLMVWLAACSYALAPHGGGRIS